MSGPARFLLWRLNGLLLGLAAWLLVACVKMAVPATAGALKFDGIKSVELSTTGLVTITWDPTSMTDAYGAPVTVNYTVYILEIASTVLTSEDVEVNSAHKVTLQPQQMPRTAGKKVAVTTATSHTLKEDLLPDKTWAIEVVASGGAAATSNEIAYAFLYAPGDAGSNSDQIEIFSGNFQSGRLTEDASGPLSVRVRKGFKPKAGEVVTFAITHNPAGATGQAISSNREVTDANGLAATQFTAGNKDGLYQISASWKSNTANFVYYANSTGELQDQINNLPESPATI